MADNWVGWVRGEKGEQPGSAPLQLEEVRAHRHHEEMGKLRFKETAAEKLARASGSGSSSRDERKEKKKRRKHTSKQEVEIDRGSSSSSSDSSDGGSTTSREHEHSRRRRKSSSSSRSHRRSRPSDSRNGPNDGHASGADEDKSEKRRRRHTSSSSRRRGGRAEASGVDDRTSDSDSDAWVPPRPSKDRPYVPYSFDDDDTESRLPGSRQSDDSKFREKLFDAMRDDEGFDPYSASASTAGLSFDYREDPTASSTSVSFGASGTASDRFVDPKTGAILNRVIFKDAMTEEEYAEHIRRGMFRRTRREEIAREEALAKERAAREKRRAEEIAKAKALEAERLRQLEERARRKAQAGTVRSREAYQASWARLVDPKRQEETLRSDDFPWPVVQESGGALDKDAIKNFLLAHLEGQQQDYEKRAKQAIRTAVLAYHPDRFERYTLRVQDARERESVRRMGCESLHLLSIYPFARAVSASILIAARDFVCHAPKCKSASCSTSSCRPCSALSMRTSTYRTTSPSAPLPHASIVSLYHCMFQPPRHPRRPVHDSLCSARRLPTCC